MRKKRKAKATKQQPLDALINQGNMHLAAGRYQDAIFVYKQLLKYEQRPEWQDALANAYLARAKQLADKEMYKEAVALWENRANLCGNRSHLELYIAWLLKSGRLIRGARIFAEANEPFRQSPVGQRLAAMLAGLLASGQTEIVEALPADMPLLQQQGYLMAAMEAYCQGDDTGLRELLKQIPFRSPYRDLRFILQALSVLDTDPQAAGVLLDKLADDSPFARFGTVVRTATLSGKPLLEALAKLDPPEQEFVFTLHGWDQKKSKLFSELQTLADKQMGAKALFKFIITHSELCDNASVQRFCLALLPHYPEGITAYERQFGPLSPFDRERLYALYEERRSNWVQAKKHWLDCYHRLISVEPQGDAALKAALILRHLAELSIQLNGPDPWDAEVEDYLVRSLEFDPEDKGIYLKLMEMTHKRDDQKAHDRWVERAVQQFSQDADILMAAAMAAYRRGAFKKAAGFAQTLLDRDPINQHARSLLISCHLAHARKQVTAAKYAPASKELDNAKQLAREADQHAIVELSQGFLALLTRQEESALNLLRQGYQRLGGGLVAYFRFLVDGGRFGLDSRQLNKYHNRIKDKQAISATKQDILLLVDLIHRYLSDGVKGISQILERLRKPLQAAIKLDYSEKEMEAICVALQRVGHYLLLQEYADAALQRWQQRPIFIFYQIVGRTKDREDRMTALDDVRLQTALDKALQEGDQRTVSLIEDFLGLSSFGLGGLPPLPPEVAQGLGAVIEDIMDEIGTDDVEEALETLIQRLQDAGLPGPPPELFPPIKGRR